MRHILNILAGWKLYAAVGIVGLMIFVGSIKLAEHRADHRGYLRGKAEAEIKIVSKVVEAQAKEVERRVVAVREVQVRSADDVRKIDQQATRIAALMAESRRLSITYDNAPCLTQDAVARLAQAGWTQ